MSYSIVSVALKFPNGLTLSFPQPARHGHIYMAMRDHFGEVEEVRLKLQESEEGFLDSNGAFLTRAEAMTVAKEQGLYPADKPKSILYSEDLW